MAIDDIVPQPKADPVVQISLTQEGEAAITDLGSMAQRLEFKASVNRGYSVSVTLFDHGYTIFNELVNRNYFTNGRGKPLELTFRIGWDNDFQYPKAATRARKAIVTNVRMFNSRSDGTKIRFDAIDPASYLLSKGKALGKTYNGKLSEVIKNVVKDVSDKLKVEVSETSDSKYSQYWMMRLDPLTFITTLLEWSSPLTKHKTMWMVAPEDYKLQIKEQFDFESKNKAYYHRGDRTNSWDMIQTWDGTGNSYLGTVHTKLEVSGLSATTGKYLDRTTSEKEVTVSDESTAEKAGVRTYLGAFLKPTEGSSAVRAVPELYSAGELGLSYEKYIDGQARQRYLSICRELLFMDIEVIGHGTWDTSVGLGVDTCLLNWVDENGKIYWPSGPWLVHGFKHIWKPGSWMTTLSINRLDEDAKIKQVGPKSNNSPPSNLPDFNPNILNA